MAAKEELIHVRPRPGVILAGIPATGADVPASLAREWERNGLVIIDDKRATARKGA